jgi:hypothetical protein
MPATEEVIKKIADNTGVSVDELTASGLLALLREKRRKVMMDRLGVLDRYNLTSREEFEGKIKHGDIPEHPAWEDLIFLENLDSALAQIDEDIRAIQKDS